MKKRILALLLAGLLTASLTSCFQPVTQTEDPTGGTEPQQTLPNETPTEEPAPTINLTQVDETVYTIVDNAKLLVDPETTAGSVQVDKITEMHRIKFSAVWSVVEYMGAEYYVATSSLTKEDLTGKTFTACNKTMYVKAETLNVRTYASANSYSPIVGKLARNDQVTVIAEGSGWSKIQYTDKDNNTSERFVSSKELSETEYVDPNTIDFSQYFEACNPAKTMYATGTVNMRVNAHAESDLIKPLLKDDQVTVVALAKIGESTWAKVQYEIKPDKEGDPSTTGTAYVNAKYLSEVKGDETTITLDDILAEYPDFTKLEEVTTFYATGICWVRSSPQAIPQNDANGNPNPNFNGIGNRQQKDSLKVVATGAEWVIIELQDGYGFVHKSILTTDPEGNPVHLSLEDLLARYTEFTAIDEITVYATGKVVNCYTEPKTNDTVPKTLASGAEVTKVAVSEDGFWCIVKTADGAYYFAGNSLFTETAPAA